MPNVIYSELLKSNLEKLCKKAFEFYDAAVAQNHISKEDTQLGVVLARLDKHIEIMDEFQSCVQVMSSDDRVKPLLGQRVGTKFSKFGVENAETCVLRFVNQLYLRKPAFDPDLFNELYDAFEELFYSDTLRFIDWVRLYNFESDVDEIPLRNGLVIKKSPPSMENQTRMREARYRPYTQFSKSDFIIERRYTKKKIVGSDDHELDIEEFNRENKESPDIFDLVIKALRILKASGIYRDHEINSEMMTFSPYAGVQTRFPFVENTVFGEKCRVSRQEVGELKILYEKIKTFNRQPFRIASNRLGFALERKHDEDRLLDFMIGLESLYLPDGNDELTFRLSLRISFMQHQDSSDRNEMYKFIKRMYRTRSKIVHGSNYTLLNEDVTKIESVLRKSLKTYLENPSRFSSDALENILF